MNLSHKRCRQHMSSLGVLGRAQRAATVVIVPNSIPLLYLSLVPSHNIPFLSLLFPDFTSAQGKYSLHQKLCGFDSGTDNTSNLVPMLIINSALKSFLSPARTRHLKLASLQKCLQNNNKKQPYDATYHLPCWCTCSLNLPPTFPFRFGTMGAPLRVQVWGRITENTSRWVQTSTLHCQILHIFSTWETTAPVFWSVSGHSAMNLCVYTCVCVRLIGIVSISKRPDSHPPSPLWNKGRPADDDAAADEPGSAVYVRTSSRDRETYCRCKRYCKCFCIRGAMCSIYKHRHMVIKLMVTLKND